MLLPVLPPGRTGSLPVWALEVDEEPLEEDEEEEEDDGVAG